MNINSRLHTNYEFGNLSISENYSVSKVVSIQIARLKEDIQVQQNLLNELENLSILFRNKQSLSVEDLTTLLGAMKMNQEKHFTKEQLELMKKGTPTTDKKVQTLAQQWSKIANSFTANDPEIQKAAEKYHAENPGNDLQHGVDAEIYQYIGKALQGISDNIMMLIKLLQPVILIYLYKTICT